VEGSPLRPAIVVDPLGTRHGSGANVTGCHGSRHGSRFRIGPFLLGCHGVTGLDPLRAEMLKDEGCMLKAKIRNLGRGTEDEHD